MIYISFQKCYIYIQHTPNTPQFTILHTNIEYSISIQWSIYQSPYPFVKERRTRNTRPRIKLHVTKWTKGAFKSDKSSVHLRKRFACSLVIFIIIFFSAQRKRRQVEIALLPTPGDFLKGRGPTKATRLRWAHGKCSSTKATSLSYFQQGFSKGTYHFF